jgi:hypothetical protein
MPEGIAGDTNGRLRVCAFAAGSERLLDGSRKKMHKNPILESGLQRNESGGVTFSDFLLKKTNYCVVRNNGNKLCGRFCRLLRNIPNKLSPGYVFNN